MGAHGVAAGPGGEMGRVPEAAGGASVGGGSIGPPPVAGASSRIYLSGGRARDIAGLFAGSNLEAIPLEGPAGAASALKACYAAWTKGATALLAAIRALATHEGIEAPLLEEWKRSQPVDALERDLAKVRSGSRDLQLLRDEVETLKNVLNSPIRRHHWVREGLHGMRQAIENGLETVVADGLKAGPYIAEIGRILGM